VQKNKETFVQHLIYLFLFSEEESGSYVYYLDKDEVYYKTFFLQNGAFKINDQGSLKLREVAGFLVSMVKKTLSNLEGKFLMNCVEAFKLKENFLYKMFQEKNAKILAGISDQLKNVMIRSNKKMKIYFNKSCIEK
jgi:hypothetical protein